MPELPEVETIRAQLAPRLEGRTLVRVEILDPRLTRPLRPLRSRRGARGRSRRRSRAARQVPAPPTRERPRAPRPPAHDRQLRLRPVTHERAVLELDDGSRLVYRDVRRFGTWLVLEERDAGAVPRGEERPGAARPAVHDRRGSARSSRAEERRSRQCSSISVSSPVSGTSTPTRRSGAHALSPLRPANDAAAEEIARLVARHPRGAANRDRASGIDATRLRGA